MSYSYFAEFYDSFTGNVNYNDCSQFICSLLTRNGINGGLLLDLACGTGSLTVSLAESGYSVIGVDSSPEMLSEAQNKMYERELNILFLCQDMCSLDLYGTIKSAVCTLDSLNHLKDLDEVRRVFSKISLFMEEDGIFIFDVNTLYKHQKVLAYNAFVFENDNVFCAWQNTLCDDGQTVNIDLDFFKKAAKGSYERYSESFSEKAYDIKIIEKALNDADFTILDKYDGYTLNPLNENSERAVIVARKGNKNGQTRQNDR